jgi:hypothetical protein
LRPVERQTTRDQPFLEIDAGNDADRNGAPVLIAIDLHALDRAASDEGIKVVRGFASSHGATFSRCTPSGKTRGRFCR